MKLFVIAAKYENETEPWIIDVWDEWTIEENEQGYREACQKAIKEAGEKTEIRVGEVEVPDSFLRDMFENHSVTGRVIEIEKES